MNNKAHIETINGTANEKERKSKKSTEMGLNQKENWVGSKEAEKTESEAGQRIIHDSFEELEKPEMDRAPVNKNRRKELSRKATITTWISSQKEVEIRPNRREIESTDGGREFRARIEDR